MIKNYLTLLLLFMTIMFFVTFSFIRLSFSIEVKSPSSFSYSDIVALINFSQIYENIKRFSSMGSRVTGYSGCEMAARYIIETLEKYNIKYEIQEYSLVVPIDHGSVITVLSPEHAIIPAYVLWPNYVQTCSTPPEGVEGRLIYVGEGRLEDFDMKEVRNNIVLMEFNTGDNWINAARLGAKAVVFIAPDATNYFESIKKFSRVPINFPRIYVNSRSGSYLRKLALSGNVTVNVQSKMRYERVIAKNIIGIIEGSEIPDEVIGICAHFDTWSVVPKLAPGADESVSVSLLLEMGRIFAEQKPKRTVYLIFLSGHWMSLAGAREFIERYMFNEPFISGKRKMLMLIGIDLSSGTKNMAILFRGDFYQYTNVGVRFSRWLSPRISQVYIPNIERQLRLGYLDLVEVALEGEGLWGSIPTPYMLDTEPFAIARGIGFTIRTTRDYRIYWGTPTACCETVNMENIRPQAYFALCLVFSFLNEEDMGIRWSEISPSRLFYSPQEIAGYITLHGKVVEFNYTSGWYTPVPNALVVTSRVRHSTYPFINIISIANATGDFVIHGLAPGPAIAPSAWQYREVGVEVRESGYYSEAFVLDNITGDIIYAPDMGEYGSRSIHFWSPCDTHPYRGMTVVFRATSITLFDLIHPQMVSLHAIRDPRFPDRYWRATPVHLELLDFMKLGEFLSFGTFYLPDEPISMFFVPPNSTFAIVFRSENLKVAFLINGSLSCPNGHGYKIGNREFRLDFTAYEIVRNMNITIAERYKDLQTFAIRSFTVEEGLAKTIEHFNRADKALKNKIYSVAYGESLAAWLWAIKAYNEITNLINDSSTVSMAFFLILIPFTFFTERLIFNLEGKKRLAVIILTTMFLLLIFYHLNPSQKILANIYVGYLGLIILLFLVIVIVLVGREFSGILSILRDKYRGKHFVEAKKLETLLFCFQFSIGNMKRRRFRTILTLLSIILIAFSLVSLTSSQIRFSARTYNTGVGAPYNGLLIKRGLIRPSEFLDYSNIIILVRALVGRDAVICPRAWYYPQSIKARSVEIKMVSSENKTITFLALIGMTPEESFLYREAIVSGRWFTDTDYYVCLVDRNIGVKVFDRVSLGGINLTVIGVFDGDLLNSYVDLDQKRITPLDPNKISVISLATLVSDEEQYEPLPWERVIIVPLKLALDLGGGISTVSVYLNNPEQIIRAAEEIVSTTYLEVTAACNKEIILVTGTTVFFFGGAPSFFILLIIGGAIICNSTLGMVKERDREIGIYSSLGLSPFGVASLFMLELVTYALVASVIGYLSGLFLNLLLISLNLLPHDFLLNSSSITVLLAIIFTIIGTLIPSLYPIYLSAKIVTPSLERKWSIPTRPKGDVWEIPLPFVFLNEEEVKSFLFYLLEFFKSYVIEGRFFTVREASFSPDDRKLNLIVALAPYEAHVIQSVSIFSPPQRKELSLVVLLHQLDGDKRVWLTSNYKFLDVLRKQFLIWKALKAEEKKKYLMLFQKE